ncbi:hypothetical protein VT84_19205 [Gemmata sp. SH-PL17]|uniref:DUF1415 domain-containing protein n=1 Tax=Gemmata sp. SH-PL17 TaxID=1630693 RepID=UPI00078ED473|nr:DUF1415 domain-containing protein [Gemmata sp. SH-PL17]AMV26536.1 hypothetical protein VT84_19205 [Gemmata sp. SH-PL17]
MLTTETVIEQTRRWVSDVVIGLNLCPFARRVFDGGLIRFTVTDAADEDALRAALTNELRSLADIPAEQVETAILIHPHTLGDFLDYNDFVVETESLIEELELTGVIQIAGFHPQYQFGGTRPGDVENYTNRSPFPMLHLLREDSITAVNDDPEKLLEIPRRNVETLRRIGKAQIQKLLGRVTS